MQIAGLVLAAFVTAVVIYFVNKTASFDNHKTRIRLVLYVKAQ
jgi:hypothetical protein